MYENLKKQVCEANLLLIKHRLVVLTWGNVSAIDRDKGIVAIKPSGISYDNITPDKIVVVDMNGNVISGKYRPSSDLLTHLELYKKFDSIGSVIHTHSRWATIWAQIGEEISPLGTTHADVFNGCIKCTDSLSDKDIINDYEKNIGIQIVNAMTEKEAKEIPAILVKNHGPFIWGSNIKESIENAVTLEEVAMMAWHVREARGRKCAAISDTLLHKHYYRKHGKKSYYGQEK